MDGQNSRKCRRQPIDARVNRLHADTHLAAIGEQVFGVRLEPVVGTRAGKPGRLHGRAAFRKCHCAFDSRVFCAMASQGRARDQDALILACLHVDAPEPDERCEVERHLA